MRYLLYIPEATIPETLGYLLLIYEVVKGLFPKWAQMGTIGRKWAQKGSVGKELKVESFIDTYLILVPYSWYA